MTLTIYIDGGSRGNPGPAAAGVVIRDESSEPLFEAGYRLGHMTNNQAEYRALLIALAAAAHHGGRRLAIFSDSQLLVYQLAGRYRVRSPQIQPLFQAAIRRLNEFDTWQAEYVPRERNRRADELVNLAMDAGTHVIQVDPHGLGDHALQGLPG